MAISSILPRKIMKNQTRQKSMSERHDYDQKQEKTNGGELVSSSDALSLAALMKLSGADWRDGHYLALGLNSAPRYTPISPRPPGSYAS